MPASLRARENALLERGLLPSPLLLDNPGVDIVARYRPSRENALLCGDFYDVVQTSDRVTHVLIGDVAGHGPDEAALGAALRIAWRTLTFAGVHGVEQMRQLERVLHAERAENGVFATVLSLAIPPDDGPITAVRAGHPGMLLHGPGSVEWIEPPTVPRWDYAVPAGPSTGWSCRPGTGCCCSPTGCSRGIPVMTGAGWAKPACWPWRGGTRRCPAHSSSTP